jgi:hypothetical protein
MESVMTFDPTFAALADEVAGAEQALVETASHDPERWWYPYELRSSARNGWSAGAMGIAMDNLIARRVFEVNADLCVRLRH